MSTSTKVGLGTSWGFDVRVGPRGAFYTVQGGLPRGVQAFRIIPSARYDVGYDVDVLPSLGPWEDYAEGQYFTTPEAAAAFLVAKVGRAR